MTVTMKKESQLQPAVEKKHGYTAHRMYLIAFEGKKDMNIKSKKYM
jgi:hypothetical protein